MGHWGSMRLFQYWDTGAPPDDVAACVESFHALNPAMRPRPFDRNDAAWYKQTDRHWVLWPGSLYSAPVAPGPVR